MRKIKIIALFVFTILLVSASIVSIQAASAISLSVGSDECAPGEVVTIPISITNNSGFVSMSLSVSYDTSALTLIYCDYTDTISHSIHGANYKSPYIMTWENDILTTNIKSTGTIAYLKFRVSEDAEEQDYSINVRIPTDGVLNANGESVDVSAAQGTITVSETHVCSFGDWQYSNSKKHISYCECGEYKTEAHNWSDGEIIKEPTHNEEGEIKYVCEDCKGEKTDVLDAEGHDWGYWTKLNDSQHRRSCSCGESETKAHNWDEGITTANITTYTCEDCGATRTDGVTIPVTGIVLDQTKTVLILNKEFDNVTVLNASILPDNATNAEIVWTNSNDSVVEMSVYNNIRTKVRLGAISEGVSEITATTVDGKFSATCLITVINDETSDNSGNLEYSYFSDGTCFVSGIGSCVDTEIVIPSIHHGMNVTGIAYRAFSGNSNITSITIPNSVTVIGVEAFDSCDNLKTIYYNGTQSMWENISVYGGNTILNSAKIVFTSNEVMFFEGAQIRINDPQGLRFVFSIPKSLYDTLEHPETTSDTGIGFGSVVIPKDILGNNALTKETPKAKIAPAVNLFEVTEDEVRFTVCIIEIPEKNYDEEYVAVPYITYMDGGVEKTIYGQQTENVTLFNIAKLAYKDPETEQKVKDYIYESVLTVVDPEYKR